jgi:hypothetical protein
MRDLLLPARCSSQSTAVANSQAAAAVDGERVRDEDFRWASACCEFEYLAAGGFNFGSPAEIGVEATKAPKAQGSLARIAASRLNMQ